MGKDGLRTWALICVLGVCACGAGSSPTSSSVAGSTDVFDPADPFAGTCPYEGAAVKLDCENLCAKVGTCSEAPECIAGCTRSTYIFNAESLRAIGACIDSSDCAEVSGSQDLAERCVAEVAGKAASTAATMQATAACEAVAGALRDCQAPDERVDLATAACMAVAPILRDEALAHLETCPGRACIDISICLNEATCAVARDATTE